MDIPPLCGARYRYTPVGRGLTTLTGNSVICQLRKMIIHVRSMSDIVQLSVPNTFVQSICPSDFEDFKYYTTKDPGCQAGQRALTVLMWFLGFPPRPPPLTTSRHQYRRPPEFQDGF